MKRQGTALERLVGAQGELPVLLHAHNEETRALKHKMKQVDNVASRFISSKSIRNFHGYSTFET